MKILYLLPLILGTITITWSHHDYTFQKEPQRRDGGAGLNYFLENNKSTKKIVNSLPTQKRVKRTAPSASPINFKLTDLKTDSDSQIVTTETIKRGSPQIQNFPGIKKLERIPLEKTIVTHIFTPIPKLNRNNKETMALKHLREDTTGGIPLDANQLQDVIQEWDNKLPASGDTLKTRRTNSLFLHSKENLLSFEGSQDNLYNQVILSQGKSIAAYDGADYVQYKRITTKKMTGFEIIVTLHGQSVGQSTERWNYPKELNTLEFEGISKINYPSEGAVQSEPKQITLPATTMYQLDHTNAGPGATHGHFDPKISTGKESLVAQPYIKMNVPERDANNQIINDENGKPKTQNIMGWHSAAEYPESPSGTRFQKIPGVGTILHTYCRRKRDVTGGPCAFRGSIKEDQTNTAIKTETDKDDGGGSRSRDHQSPQKIQNGQPIPGGANGKKTVVGKNMKSPTTSSKANANHVNGGTTSKRSEKDLFGRTKKANAAGGGKLKRIRGGGHAGFGGNGVNAYNPTKSRARRLFKNEKRSPFSSIRKTGRGGKIDGGKSSLFDRHQKKSPDRSSLSGGSKRNKPFSKRVPTSGEKLGGRRTALFRLLTEKTGTLKNGLKFETRKDAFGNSQLTTIAGKARKTFFGRRSPQSAFGGKAGKNLFGHRTPRTTQSGKAAKNLFGHRTPQTTQGGKGGKLNAQKNAPGGRKKTVAGVKAGKLVARKNVVGRSRTAAPGVTAGKFKSRHVRGKSIGSDGRSFTEQMGNGKGSPLKRMTKKGSQSISNGRVKTGGRGTGTSKSLRKATSGGKTRGRVLGRRTRTKGLDARNGVKSGTRTNGARMSSTAKKGLGGKVMKLKG